MSGISTAEYWNDMYREGHGARYPWDCVVTFICRHRPLDKSRREIRILEVGCGTGANMWFAAREGYTVVGVDISELAINAAISRFKNEGLPGDFLVSHLCNLPFADSSFDLVVDRASMTCLSSNDYQISLNEVRRVIRKDGTFFSNVYIGRCHGSCRGATHFYQHDYSKMLGSWCPISLQAIYIKNDIEESRQCSELRAILKPY